ncbi:hypothetical protein Dimus_003306, partial [Dionaea muscipula]
MDAELLYRPSIEKKHAQGITPGMEEVFHGCRAPVQIELREELITPTTDHGGSRVQANHYPGPSSGLAYLPCNKQHEAELRHGRAQLFDKLPLITFHDNSSRERPRIGTTPSSGLPSLEESRAQVVRQ